VSLDLWTALRLAGALATIAALLFALRLGIAAAGFGGRGHRARGPLLRSVDSLALGPGIVLHVVEAGGRRLLLGAGSGGISLLGELEIAGEAPPGGAKGIDPRGAKLASDVRRE
jgi:flagellar biogenesis protein FliO